MKKNFARNVTGTIVDVAIGSSLIGVVSNSNMPQGFKDITNIGIGAGIASRAMKRFGGRR